MFAPEVMEAFEIGRQEGVVRSAIANLRLVGNAPTKIIDSLMAPTNGASFRISEVGQLDTWSRDDKRMSLRQETIDGLVQVANDITTIISDIHGIPENAVDTIYHDATHAYFTMHHDDPSVAAAIQAGTDYYSRAEVNGPGRPTAFDAFDGAAAAYVGNRVCMHQWVTLELDRLRAEATSGPFDVCRALIWINRIEVMYNGEMDRLVFGRGKDNGKSWDISSPLSPALKEFLDSEILENRIHDRFCDSKAFSEAVAAIKAAALAKVSGQGKITKCAVTK